MDLTLGDFGGLDSVSTFSVFHTEKDHSSYHFPHGGFDGFRCVETDLPSALQHAQTRARKASHKLQRYESYVHHGVQRALTDLQNAREKLALGRQAVDSLCEQSERSASNGSKSRSEDRATNASRVGEPTESKLAVALTHLQALERHARDMEVRFQAVAEFAAPLIFLSMDYDPQRPSQSSHNHQRRAIEAADSDSRPPQHSTRLVHSHSLPQLPSVSHSHSESSVSRGCCVLPPRTPFRSTSSSLDPAHSMLSKPTEPSTSADLRAAETETETEPDAAEMDIDAKLREISADLNSCHTLMQRMLESSQRSPTDSDDGPSETTTPHPTPIHHQPVGAGHGLPRARSPPELLSQYFKRLRSSRASLSSSSTSAASHNASAGPSSPLESVRELLRLDSQRLQSAASLSQTGSKASACPAVTFAAPPPVITEERSTDVSPDSSIVIVPSPQPNEQPSDACVPAPAQPSSPLAPEAPVPSELQSVLVESSSSFADIHAASLSGPVGQDDYSNEWRSVLSYSEILEGCFVLEMALGEAHEKLSELEGRYSQKCAEFEQLRHVHLKSTMAQLRTLNLVTRAKLQQAYQRIQKLETERRGSDNEEKVFDVVKNNNGKYKTLHDEVNSFFSRDNLLYMLHLLFGAALMLSSHWKKLISWLGRRHKSTGSSAFPLLFPE